MKMKLRFGSVAEGWRAGGRARGRGNPLRDISRLSHALSLFPSSLLLSSLRLFCVLFSSLLFCFILLSCYVLISPLSLSSVFCFLSFFSFSFLFAAFSFFSLRFSPRLLFSSPFFFFSPLSPLILFSLSPLCSLSFSFPLSLPLTSPP